MVKKSILFLFFAISYCGTIFADNYAILISAGKATSDYAFTNTEYWFDLYLTYEYLLISEHYDSAKVFVFYGDGTDYNSSNVRYKKELHNWGQITDYDNSYSTMNSIIPSLNNVISDKDNLLFYWVVGHGDKMGTSNDDNYRVMIEHNSYYDSEYVYKTQLVALINSITHYNKRKIIWMTCESGAMGGGSINPNNNLTTLITSSTTSETSYSDIYNNEIHNNFGYALFCLSTQKYPDGTICDLSQYCPGTAIVDSLLSINELRTGISTFISLNSNDTHHPCIFDMGGISNKIFIGENKKIKDVNINANSSYWLDKMEVSNVQFNQNLNISINTDVRTIIRNKTTVPTGTSLIVK